MYILIETADGLVYINPRAIASVRDDTVGKYTVIKLISGDTYKSNLPAKTVIMKLTFGENNL